MRIRRSASYLGLFVGLVLLGYAGFSRYEVHYVMAGGLGISEQTMSISGFGIVFETAQDGLARSWEGQLLSRRYRLAIDPTGAEQIVPNEEKKDETCYT